MIDKIEVMLPAETEFRGELNELHSVSPYDPCIRDIRPSKFYHLVSDLRPRGVEALLHVGLKLGSQKSHGGHKIELLETGKKSMRDIQATIEAIADCDSRLCRVGRIDLAVDVPSVALSWFRSHAYVKFKQFLCAHAKVQDSEFSELGKKTYQTLYFGKRPACIRIYDKVAERTAHYELWKRKQIRLARQEGVEPPEFPTVDEWLSVELPQTRDSAVLTRVENQLGGRVPEALRTVYQTQANVADFNPFSKMQLISGRTKPPTWGDRRFTVPEWLAGMYLHQNWNATSAQEMRAILNRDRNGNRLLARWKEFIPEDGEQGIAELELYERYRDSVSRQLAA